MSITNDLIIGFPGETEEDFQATLDLIREVNYGYAYSFKYSTRPGTPAAERPQVDAAEADDRLQRIQALITRQQQEIQNEMVGRDLNVLIEKPGRHKGQMVGRSPYLQAVHLDCDAELVGSIVDVAIRGASTNSLSGILAP